jgi:hypothetical protein
MDRDTYLKIQRPADQCLMCEADLVAARKHPSAILMEDEDMLRRDYCAACWERLSGEEFFSFWIAKRDVVPARTRILREERDRMLLAYFERLSTEAQREETSAEREARRFFLAHLLMRFRVFRWLRTEHEDGRIVFQNVQTAEEWSISQVELSDEAVLQVKQEIEIYLRKGEDVDVAL